MAFFEEEEYYVEFDSFSDLEKYLSSNPKVAKSIKNMLSLNIEKAMVFFEHCKSLGGKPVARIDFTEWGAVRSLTLSCRRVKASRVLVDSWEEWASRKYRVIVEGKNGEKMEIPYASDDAVVYTPRGFAKSWWIEVESEIAIDVSFKVWIKKEYDGEYVPVSRASIKIGD